MTLVSPDKCRISSKDEFENHWCFLNGEMWKGWFTKVNFRWNFNLKPVKKICNLPKFFNGIPVKEDGFKRDYFDPIYSRMPFIDMYGQLYWPKVVVKKFGLNYLSKETFFVYKKDGIYQLTSLQKFDDYLDRWILSINQIDAEKYPFEEMIIKESESLEEIKKNVMKDSSTVMWQICEIFARERIHRENELSKKFEKDPKTHEDFFSEQNFNFEAIPA